MPTQKTRNKPKTQSRLDFKIMSLGFKIRDIFRPRSRIAEEVGIKNGYRVLDYGCGPGSYVMPVTKLIGATGALYALDILPLAIESVKMLISKKGLTNVQVILSECDTGLTDESIDIILLYDILHELDNGGEVLMELHRVLKPGGFLSVSDHHLKDAELVTGITGGGLFKLTKKGKNTHSFTRETVKT
ncbi:MAG: class I SAM-dependent methyltransferase [Dehalococcoidales bacterium]|nr:class I SAM-dependent methyltransferase [Dehalococcoidales bacterium]